MVVVMQERATEAQIQAVIAQLVEMGFDVHRSTGASRTVIGAVGDGRRRSAAARGPGGRARSAAHHRAVQAREPHVQAGEHRRRHRRRAHRRRRGRRDGRAVLGRDPRSRSKRRPRRSSAPARRSCAAARSSRAARRTAFRARRGGLQDAARRGRSARPEARHRGHGDQRRSSWSSATPTSCRSARATCRTTRCCASSGKSRKPVLLKRGISATIEEWLLSAEYMLAGGNKDVMLCERGIRTFESYTRNTLDISAIPVVQKLSHLPIIVDPSHGTGRRDKVAPMARAAVAAGADGLIIEVHCDPDHARVRRRAVAVPGAVRAADGRAAHHRAGDRPQHLRRAGRAARLEPLDATWRAPAGVGAGRVARRHRRARADRRIDRVGVRGRVAGVQADRRRSRGECVERAATLGAIDGGGDIGRGVSRACDLVVLAAPVPAILDAHRRGRAAPDSTRVITDVGSTKRHVMAAAQRGGLPRFVGGHPMAGTEHGGLEHARADLFAGRPWLLVADAGDATPSAVVESFADRARRDAAPRSTPTRTIARWPTSATCRSSSPAR